MSNEKSKEKFENTVLPNGFMLAKGKYIIYQKISSGGYGSVYLAKNEKSQFCAIKEFLPKSICCRTNERNPNLKFRNDDEKIKFDNMLKSFYLEAETVSKFNHHNVIKIIDVFKENNTAYIVMPLEKGMSLFNYVHFYNKEHNSKLPDKEIRDIFIQICDGIDFLHNNNYLHLDIKPGNVWIKPDGNVVILDLGSTRNIDEYQNQANPAFTAGYAPPEQYVAIKDAKIDNRTDIYAIGGVLKFCIEIEAPIISLKRKNDDESFLSERMSQVNYHLLKIVDKCMKLKPDQRYQNVYEIKKDLEKIYFINEKDEMDIYMYNLLKTKR